VKGKTSFKSNGKAKVPKNPVMFYRGTSQNK